MDALMAKSGAREQKPPRLNDLVPPGPAAAQRSLHPAGPCGSFRPLRRRPPEIFRGAAAFAAVAQW